MRASLRLALVVCLLSVSSVAFAQEGPLQVAALGRVFREGATTTASVSVPANITNTYTSARLTLDIATTDYVDPNTRVTMRLYRLLPTGQWQMMLSSGEFIGGPRVDEDGVVNPPMEASVSLPGLAGYDVRAEIETATRLRVGIKVELIPR